MQRIAITNYLLEYVTILNDKIAEYNKLFEENDSKDVIRDDTINIQSMPPTPSPNIAVMTSMIE